MKFIIKKAKNKIFNRLCAFVLEFGNDVFSSDWSVFYCKIYDIRVTAEKRFTILHLSGDKHIYYRNKSENHKDKMHKIKLSI